MSIDSHPEIETILKARSEQIERYGHTPERDLEQSPAELAYKAKRYLAEAIELLQPGDRQDFDVALKRLARGGALVLAAMHRTRIEHDRASAAAEPRIEWPISHREAG